ncbi:MAG: MBL fold metallo-hydrolase [Thermodesulfobacteriota bacterium]|nr:MBL fold metallo-hydrolase [Thermodesulfobacteriota bacterium]
MNGLKEADNISLSVLMDNYTDLLLQSNDRIKRPEHYRDGKVLPPLVAEHAFSVFIEVFQNSRVYRVLFDTGWSETGFFTNIELLQIDFKELEAIILSHGHMDHFGSLIKILKSEPKKYNIIAHPDVFLQKRFLKLPDGRNINMPILERAQVLEYSKDLIETKNPYLFPSDLIMTTGEVERTTDFEKGMPNAFLQRGDKIEEDIFLDDQGLIVNVKGKGLVVITGCAHAGIINIIHHVKKLTGINKIYAVIGGFHLIGPREAELISMTVQALKEIEPSLICPMHCTGWRATKTLYEEFPEEFFLSSVGSKFIL